jgi:hypothetical protein
VTDPAGARVAELLRLLARGDRERAERAAVERVRAAGDEERVVLVDGLGEPGVGGERRELADAELRHHLGESRGAVLLEEALVLHLVGELEARLHRLGPGVREERLPRPCRGVRERRCLVDERREVGRGVHALRVRRRAQVVVGRDLAAHEEPEVGEALHRRRDRGMVVVEELLGDAEHRVELDAARRHHVVARRRPAQLDDGRIRVERVRQHLAAMRFARAVPLGRLGGDLDVRRGARERVAAHDMGRDRRPGARRLVLEDVAVDGRRERGGER